MQIQDEDCDVESLEGKDFEGEKSFEDPVQDDSVSWLYTIAMMKLSRLGQSALKKPSRTCLS